MKLCRVMWGLRIIDAWCWTINEVGAGCVMLRDAA